MEPCFPQIPSVVKNDLELSIIIPNAKSIDQQGRTNLHRDCETQ